jgi:hypothetical protein
MPELQIGIEIEGVVVDENGNLDPRAIDAVKKTRNPCAHQELGPYQVELAAFPGTIADQREQLTDAAQDLNNALPNDSRLLFIGAYPKRFSPKVTGDTRLEDLTRKMDDLYEGGGDGYSFALASAVSSMQTNMATKNPITNEELIEMHRYGRRIVPAVIGATTNSAHFMGKRNGDPGSYSTFVANGDKEVILGGRLSLLGFNPLSQGVSREFKSFEDYQKFLTEFAKKVTIEASSPESYAYPYSKIKTLLKEGGKLSPGARRIEIRPGDALPSFEDNLAVAAFLQFYVAASFNELGCPWPTDESNLTAMCDLAQRHGTDFNYAGTHMKSYLQGLVPTLMDYAGSDEREYLTRFSELLDRNPAWQQRKDGPDKSIWRAVDTLADEIGLN